MRLRLLASVVAALMIAAPSAFADTVEIGGGGFTKTDPMETTDFFTVPVIFHATTTYENWLGAGFDLWWDPTEVAFVGTTPGAGFSADLGLTTASSGWSGQSLGWFNDLTAASGTTVFESSTQYLGNLLFHVLNSSIGQNSDVDIWVNYGFNLWHAGTTGSLTSAFTTTGSVIAVGSYGVEHVPEPGTAALMLGGLGVLVAARRRGRRV